ncbi:MAG TPA: hypothetical protein VN843_04615, partial [Anaerolineales bacterium]|nr:hypothetical protein [Anaerolineales bacterium]
MLSFIYEILKSFGPKLGRFAVLIYEHQRLAFISSVGLLILSIGLSIWYWQRSVRYDEIVRNTLSADMETTPQRFKGLEAFIYSNLKQNVSNNLDVREVLQKRALPEKFLTACRELQAKLDAFQSDTNWEKT